MIQGADMRLLPDVCDRVLDTAIDKQSFYDYTNFKYK